MKRREFISLLGGAAAAWPLAAGAQQADKVHRISVVNIIAENDPEASPRVTAFELGLRRLGWATERDLRIDYYWDAGDSAHRRVVAKQVAETRPDVVVTAATPATEALRDEARGVPIVFVQVLIQWVRVWLRAYRILEPILPGFLTLNSRWLANGWNS